MSNSKNNLVPMLRFPEFENDGEWGNNSLEELCEVITKGTTPTTLGFNYTEKGINFIKIESIQNGRINLSKVAFISDECNEALKRSQLKENDILFSIAGALGVVAPVTIKDLPANTNQALSIVRLKKGQNKDYIVAFLGSNHISVEISKIKAGAAQPNISLNQVGKFNILLPRKTLEQQKIAACLSSLDEVITAESQKLEVLKDHKKGLLQNVLPRAGETVPKFRFKEFEDSGEWEFDTFSEYIKLYRGSSPRPIQNYFTTDDIGVNWIKIGDTKKADNFIIKQVEERITPEGAEKSRKVNVGELILANSMSFGKTYQLAIEGYIYDGWFVLREYEQFFDKQFLLQLLNSDYMQTQYKKLSAGGIVQNISSDIVYKTILPHTSISEQKQIAAILTSLDEIISAQRKKVEALQLQKKGLLQGLFPNLNEVTA